MKLHPLAAVIPFLFAGSLFAVTVGAPAPGTPNITVQVDEAFHVFVNGTVVPQIGNDPVTGAPIYPTGGIFVGAGDINYLENAANTAVSDVIRIYNVGNGTGDTFSAFSDNADGIDDPLDQFGLPNPIAGNPFASVVEPNPYIAVDATAGGTGTWIFNSDAEVPEPASLALLTFAAFPLLTRRHR